ncbi:MAG: hypothetical protein ACT4P2_06880 [Pseudomonadota bacterium]
MTKRWQAALDKLSKLPPEDQDALAIAGMEEPASPERRAAVFAESKDRLARLADAALAEFRSGAATAPEAPHPVLLRSPNPSTMSPNICPPCPRPKQRGEGDDHE